MASALRIILGVLFCLSLGLLPTGIAILRNHPRTGAILVWNTVGSLLFGIGWLVALVMSLTDAAESAKQTIIIQNVVTQHNAEAKTQG